MLLFQNSIFKMSRIFVPEYFSLKLQLFGKCWIREIRSEIVWRKLKKLRYRKRDFRTACTIFLTEHHDKCFIVLRTLTGLSAPKVLQTMIRICKNLFWNRAFIRQVNMQTLMQLACSNRKRREPVAHKISTTTIQVTLRTSTVMHQSSSRRNLFPKQFWKETGLNESEDCIFFWLIQSSLHPSKENQKKVGWWNIVGSGLKKGTFRLFKTTDG